jgi:hypothetical protein
MSLQRRSVCFAGADSRCAQQFQFKDLAVTDRASFGRGLNGFDNPRCGIAAAGDFDLDFGDHVGGVFGTTINFGLAFLAAKTLCLGHRHSRYAKTSQRFAHLVQLMRFDNGNYIFHADAPNCFGIGDSSAKPVPLAELRCF